MEEKFSKEPNYTPAILLLEDGTVYHGKAAGKIGTTTGEICFNTGMTGYQEIFTDPSYFGQLLVTTNAHIGNYGTKSSEVESGSIKIAGLICKNFTVQYSRDQADDNIQDYFEKEGLVGISDVDTRAIVRHIRHVLRKLVKGGGTGTNAGGVESITPTKSVASPALCMAWAMATATMPPAE